MCSGCLGLVLFVGFSFSRTSFVCLVTHLGDVIERFEFLLELFELCFSTYKFFFFFFLFLYFFVGSLL